MIKYLLILFFSIVTLSNLCGQESKPEYRGKVSYVTLQNIYIRFEQSNDLAIGDTMFVLKASKLIPLIVVESKSSLSAMGKPLVGAKATVGTEVLGLPHKTDKKPVKNTNIGTAVVANQTTVPTETKKNTSGSLQHVTGRVSAAAYSSFSDNTSQNLRLRYNFSMQANNIANSKFSTDTYIAFTHRADDWAAVQDNIFNALKIYGLAVKYQTGKQSFVWAGRKINPFLSNIGAIDGLQYETGSKSMRYGAIVGFRPDYSDYSFNANLLQYGAYIAHEMKNNTGFMQSSMVLFEQKNNGKTDRRFAYLQHSNSLLKNLYGFASTELDLYKVENGVQKNSLTLTSLFLSLRYQIIRQLSLSASYDALQNVIYYETYKNMVDKLLDEATRQGINIRLNYRPTNFINVGLNSSYRYRDNDIRPNKTYNGFITFSKIPGLSSVTLTYNNIQNSYLDGSIMSIRIDKDLFKNKIYSSLGYRHVNYDFYNSEMTLLQNIGEVELNWMIAKKFTLSASYEGTFEQKATYNRVYLSLTKRF